MPYTKTLQYEESLARWCDGSAAILVNASTTDS